MRYDMHHDGGQLPETTFPIGRLIGGRALRCALPDPPPLSFCDVRCKQEGGRSHHRQVMVTHRVRPAVRNELHHQVERQQPSPPTTLKVFLRGCREISFNGEYSFYSVLSNVYKRCKTKGKKREKKKMNRNSDPSKYNLPQPSI